VAGAVSPRDDRYDAVERLATQTRTHQRPALPRLDQDVSDPRKSVRYHQIISRSGAPHTIARRRSTPFGVSTVTVLMQPG
jgi:hypothetical protein